MHPSGPTLPPARRRRRPAHVLILGLAVAGLTALGSGVASAHVTVRADNTTAGSFSALTFRVPNESDTAGTVKVSVELPTDTPFLYVSTKPVPGWTASAVEAPLAKPLESYGTTITKAVRTVTWEASKGTQIAPGEYQEFSLSAGPLPDAAVVSLPATQTYGDGKVVRWDQPTPSSGEEPKHPAPVIQIQAAAESSPAASPSQSADPSAPTAQAAQSDGLARGLAVAALVVSAAGLATALVSLRRRRGSA